LTIEPRGRVPLGSTGPRELRTVRYTLTNTSATPLALRLADLSPGLTLRGAALEQSFAPGQTLPLTLTVDPTGFVGHQTRNVRLITDDPRQGEYRLPLSLEIRPDLTVDATRKSLGAVGLHESPQAVFRFIRETGQPTVLTVAGPLPPYLEAEVIPESTGARLQLTLRPRQVPAGTALGLETLRVSTSAPEQPAFTLYLEWQVRHPVEPKPARMVFLDPATRSLELRLRSRVGAPLRILEARVEGEGFSVDPPDAGEAPERVLVIRRTASREARATLILRFGGEDEPLKVPLSFLPPGP
jgi:hypothetical protein